MLLSCRSWPFLLLHTILDQTNANGRSHKSIKVCELRLGMKSKVHHEENAMAGARLRAAAQSHPQTLNIVVATDKFTTASGLELRCSFPALIA